MLYSDVGGIFLSVIFSSLHGIIMGALALFLSLVFSFALTMKESVSESFGSYSLKSIKESAIHLRSFAARKERKKSFLEDFMYAFSYGIFLLILSYVACDGELRLYIIVFSFFFFYAFKKTFGKWLNFLFEYILYAIGVVILYTLSFVWIPMRKNVRFVKRLYHKTLTIATKKIDKSQKKTKSCIKKQKNPSEEKQGQNNS